MPSRREAFFVAAGRGVGMRLDLRFAGRICAALFLGAAAAIAAERRPNVIVVLADDHATQAVSCYGSGLNATPHIDRLAREGMRFDRCYVTNSICGPSRACILTGKYSLANSTGTRFTTPAGSR